MLSSLIWSDKLKRAAPGSCKASSDQNEDEGLKLILTKLTDYENNSNVVIKPISLMNSTGPSDDHDQFCSYLKSCHLCRKPLRLDKEIYMYRGDLGFCSVECRDRQIYMDEAETSTQYQLQRCRDVSGRADAGQDLGEFRHRRRQFPSQKSRIVFS